MSKKDGVLFLVQKEPWFSMTKSGQKQEEYREIKTYYTAKWLDPYDKYLSTTLLNALGVQTIQNKFLIEDANDILNQLQYHTVHFSNGMPKRGTSPEKHIEFRNPKIRISKGRPEWGAKPGKLYFVITWDK